jgi:rhodanese-related sulfurtransferase
MFGINEIDVDTLAKWKEEGVNYRLIDIRTDAEVAQGILDGAEIIPMHLIPLKANDFKDDEKVVFYCRSGNRSGQVCAFLTQNGVGQNAYNLRGGIIAWARSGYPVVGPENQKAHVA